MTLEFPSQFAQARSRRGSLGCLPVFGVLFLLSGLAPSTLRRLETETLRTAYEAGDRSPWSAFSLAKRLQEDGRNLEAAHYYRLFLNAPAIQKLKRNQYVEEAIRGCGVMR